MKHLNLLAFVVFSLVVAWVFMLSAEAKRNIQRPILSVFGIVNKAANAISTDEDMVNGVNLAPDDLAEKYSKEELAARYSYLLRDYTELQVVKSQYLQIQQDNNNLRSALGFVKRAEVELGHIAEDIIPARVIKRESTTWWKEIRINKGENSGLVLDSPVLTTVSKGGEDARPALIGKVIGISPNTARVLLLTDERCKFAARIEGTQESGLLMGSRIQDGQLKLRYLSKNLQDADGLRSKRVFSSDVGGIAPNNFLLGNITNFEQREFYGEATVSPAADFVQLSEVFVLILKQQPDESAIMEEVPVAEPRRAVPVPEEETAGPAPEVPPRAVPTGEGDE